MKRIVITATISLLAFVVESEKPGIHVLAQRTQESQFIVSLLRADGTIIPFAQYGNSGWWNPWPRPSPPAGSIYVESTEVMPHSLGDLPEPWFRQCGKTPRTWYFWSPAGPLKVFRSSKVVQVRAHSQSNWALLTDFPKQGEGGIHSQIGVALSVNIKVDPMIEIKSNSAESDDIASFVKQIIEHDETAELDRIRGQRPASDVPVRQFALTKQERATIKTSLTKLYGGRSLVRGERLYYFEAEKHYPKPAASGVPSCDDISVFQGWVSTQGKGGLGLHDSRLFLTDCDRKGSRTARPLGTMILKNQTFLFVYEHGWEDERYTILELDNSGLHRVLETDGG